MNRPTRGAARVSVVWMITVLVLFFASLAFAFVATSDLSTQEQLRRRADAEKETAVARFDAEADAARGRATAIGWFDEQSADPRVNVEAMKTTLESFKDAFGITEASVKTLEAALTPAINAYKARGDELEQLRNRITTLEGELRQSRKTVTDITAAKDAELAQLRQQLTDKDEKYQRNEQDVSRRLAEAQDQIAALDAEKSDLQASMEEAAKAAAKQIASLQARVRSMSNEIAFKNEPDRPDGEVLAVASNGLQSAWIDVGANQRLARGTRFDIISGTPGSNRLKGMCEVVRLKPDSAEVRLLDVADEYDPIVPGDRIVNPLYTREGVRQAVLAGRFSSPSEAQLIKLLERIGIEVQKKVDVDTDYLILGSAVWTDEDGETLDEPRQPTELEVYREAESKGVNIVSVNQLRSYFVF